jgi:hypothetical protein
MVFHFLLCCYWENKICFKTASMKTLTNYAYFHESNWCFQAHFLFLITIQKSAKAVIEEFLKAANINIKDFREKKLEMSNLPDFFLE